MFNLLSLIFGHYEGRRYRARMASLCGLSCRLLLAAFMVIILLSGTTLSQNTQCPLTKCSSNDVEIRGFKLDVSSECVNNEATATLYADVFLNGGNAGCVKIFADVWQGGVYDYSTVFNLGSIDKPNPNRVITVNAGTIQWDCGKRLDIKNILIVWDYCAGVCPYSTQPNYPKCNDDTQDQRVVIPGITVRKIVTTGTNCDCTSGTAFPVSISETTIPYSNSKSFDCAGGDWVLSPLTSGKTYSVTESITSGWVLDSVTVTSSLGTPSYTSTTRGVNVLLRAEEEVIVTFTNKKCQAVDAGPDIITCAGDFVLLQGTASCYQSILWKICPGSPCLGTLVTPIDGDYSKATYTPLHTANGLETTCTLCFTATGACPGEASDSMIVHVVEEPNAVIKPAT